MKFIKKAMLVAVLAASSMAAHAEMTAMADQDLSAINGQDGVSIAGNLNVNIGSFTYTNTNDAAGQSASVSFNNIKATGLIAATIDVVSSAYFYAGPMTAAGVGGSFFNNVAGVGTDVVQIGFPSSANLTVANTAALLSVSVNSITMGGSTASFGSLALNNIDLRGSNIWLWAH